MSSTLSKTEFTDKYMPILQPFEALVVGFYRDFPEMYDRDLLSVYEALMKYYRARLTNFPLPQHKLKEFSCEIYDFLFKFLEEKEKSYTLQEIQDCLKTLEKSLKLWNREFGVRGYLDFISRYN